MAKKPFFSIIIPTYNRIQNLKFALYCILRQNFLDFEIIISDNCSIDDTNNIVTNYKDKRIKYFKNKKNIGVISNIKKAITYAKGEYIFLHSDDDCLFYENSLEILYKKIKKYNPGYIRINYLCVSSNKKQIFDFKINKSFTDDIYLPSFSESKEILSFILGSDASFVTGIVFKNDTPDNITIINCEPMSWIKILFYVTAKNGAYFIGKPCIIASWSQWRAKENGNYQLYNLTNGRLESEDFFNVVSQQIGEKEYKIFLHNQLMGIYVRLFPLVKYYVGNKNMLQLSRRINELDFGMRKSITFWVYLIFSLILPKSFIYLLKNSYLYVYTRLSKINNNTEVLTTFKKLNQEYTLLGK